MKLADKILALRKQRGMSQEELAEKLKVSRQAVSRWEMSSAQPDANNILQLSKLFAVTTDYLLNEDYPSDGGLPNRNEVKEDGSRQILIYLITLEAIMLMMQFMCVFLLQSFFFGVLNFLPFVAAIGSFEYVFRKKATQQTDKMLHFRKKFYKISAWLGLYFPIRLLILVCMNFYPRPYSALVLECVILTVYISAALLVNLALEKAYLHKNK